MGLLDDIGKIAKRVAGGSASVADVDAYEEFDQVAGTLPQSTLAEGIAHAFKSDQTPEFGTMVTGLFGQSNPDQKAGLLNQLLGALGPGGVQQLLGGTGGLAGLGGILAGGTVTPQQAQQVPPQTVEVLAQQAAKKDPSIMDKAASFYAQNPTLVKALGAGALALLMSKVSSARR